jgi:hypothetical protein
MKRLARWILRHELTFEKALRQAMLKDKLAEEYSKGYCQATFDAIEMRKALERQEWAGTDAEPKELPIQ